MLQLICQQGQTADSPFFTFTNFALSLEYYLVTYLLCNYLKLRYWWNIYMYVLIVKHRSLSNLSGPGSDGLKMRLNLWCSTLNTRDV